MAYSRLDRNVWLLYADDVLHDSLWLDGILFFQIFKR